MCVEGYTFTFEAATLGWRCHISPMLPISFLPVPHLPRVSQNVNNLTTNKIIYIRLSQDIANM